MVRASEPGAGDGAECPRRRPPTIRQSLQTSGFGAPGGAGRGGRLEIGETSVVIAVSAPHRRAAFEACEWAIRELKRTVPIWKKEVFADGEVWVEGESSADYTDFADKNKAWKSG